MGLSVHSESNIADVIAEAERAVRTSGPVDGEIQNPTDYAQYLQDRVGYYVVNDSVLQANVESEVRKATEEASAKGELLSDAVVVRAMFFALQKTVRFYQSVIGFKQDRGKFKLPPRPKHPTGWADDSETLVRSYQSLIRQAGRILDFTTYEQYPA